MILKNDRKQGKGHKEIVLKSKFKMLTNPWNCVWFQQQAKTQEWSDGALCSLDWRV